MKNFLLLTAVFSCHVLAAKVEAAQIVSGWETDTKYIIVQYSAPQAQMAENEIGHLPKRHLTPPGSSQVWAAFDSKSPNATRFESYSETAFIVSHSRLTAAVKECKEHPTTDYETRPFCSPEFLKLAEVIND